MYRPQYLNVSRDVEEKDLYKGVSIGIEQSLEFGA